MSSIIGADLVLLDTDAGADKEAVIGRMAGLLTAAGRATDAAGLTAAALAREAQSATGLPGGIAIPHCRSAAVRPSVSPRGWPGRCSRGSRPTASASPSPRTAAAATTSG